MQGTLNQNELKLGHYPKLSPFAAIRPRAMRARHGVRPRCNRLSSEADQGALALLSGGPWQWDDDEIGTVISSRQSDAIEI